MAAPLDSDILCRRRRHEYPVSISSLPRAIASTSMRHAAAPERKIQQFYWFTLLFAAAWFLLAK